MQITRNCCVFLLLLVACHAGASSSVLQHPEPAQSLASRWTWAVHQSESFKDGVWIGYSISRLMGERDSIGHYGDDRTGLTVLEMITGTKLTGTKREVSEKSIRDEAQRVLDETERSEKKVWKDVAVLIEYESKSISRVSLSNMNLTFPFKKMPILWLGSAQNEQSIELLKLLYQKTAVTKRQEELIAAIALHQTPDLVIPFLKRIVESEQETELRKSAVFWLGQTQEPQAMKYLVEVIHKAEPVELRKSAVFSLSQMDFPEADQALMDIATQVENREARMEAIFWIGQEGFDNAPKFLEQIAYQETDQEVQKKAVFSISQLKKQLGIPVLTRIAKNHPQTMVREEAVFWIGQTGSTTEGEMLEKIAFQDPNRGVRKKAVFSISQMKKDNAIISLERIAKTHPETEIRKEAIFWLGQMNDARAKNVLIQILKE